MKLGVLSDIHCGYRPLRACLDALLERGAEGFLLLGDYVSDLPHPERTMEMLRSLMRVYPCYAVKGNREASMLQRRAGECPHWRYDSGFGSLLHSAENLSEESLCWFRSLPATRLVEFEGLPVLRLCHGSPDALRGLIRREDGSAERELEKLDADWLIGGHNHEQTVFSHKGKTYLNPGTVRMRDRAQCALLTGEDGRWTAELMTVDYDVKSYIREVIGSGFLDLAPVFSRGVLYEMITGKDIIDEMVSRAFRYQREMGSSLTPEQTESCWQRAGRELDILEVEKWIS